MPSVRLIRHEIVKDTGSFEVRPQVGRSRFFHFEDNPGRRLRPEQMTGEEARELAKALARGLAITRAR